MRRILSLLWLVLVPWPSFSPAGAGAPVAVTTDTAAYCARLSTRADAHLAGPDARRLVQTGTAQCARGEIRGGIMHLRRALLLIRAHDGDGAGAAWGAGGGWRSGGGVVRPAGWAAPSVGGAAPHP